MPFKGRGESFDDRPYRAISDIVTVPVVDEFEIVDVTKQADLTVLVRGGDNHQVELSVKKSGSAVCSGGRAAARSRRHHGRHVAQISPVHRGDQRLVPVMASAERAGVGRNGKVEAPSRLCLRP